VAAVAQILNQTGTLSAIIARVRCVRARMRTSELIDGVVIRIGSALSGEPTLHTFDACLLPFAEPFMALFERT